MTKTSSKWLAKRRKFRGFSLIMSTLMLERSSVRYLTIITVLFMYKVVSRNRFDLMISDHVYESVGA